MSLAANLVPSTNNTTAGGNDEPIHLTDATFNDIIKQGITFVDFWAEWCGPCKAMTPIIRKMTLKWKDKVKIAKLDVDESLITATRFGITGIPAYIIFVNGVAKEQMSNAVPESIINNFIENAYGKYSSEVKSIEETKATN